MPFFIGCVFCAALKLAPFNFLTPEGRHYITFTQVYVKMIVLEG